MKIRISVLVFYLGFLSAGLHAQLDPARFEHYFKPQTLRVDYFHIGDGASESIVLDRLYIGGAWSGNPERTLDPFNNGRYACKVFDAGGGPLIFSRGFDSYFGEYRTTAPAGAGQVRVFHETALIPLPRGKIQLRFEVRDRANRLQPLAVFEIDPRYDPLSTERRAIDAKIFRPVDHGAPQNHVDIAILAEGYTSAQEEKFIADLKRMVKVFFSQEPYRRLQEHFNVYGVFQPSPESGCDEPRRNVYRATTLGTSFNALELERYLLSEENRAIRDVAGRVPYDAVVILVNSDRYGGGGIYNFYCTLTADNVWHPYTLLHEFGHAFGGLGDEYYTSAVAYNDFYPPGVEPLEPNITALLDPDTIKWKTDLTPHIPLPTPWDKAVFDDTERTYQSRRKELNDRIAAASRRDAPAEEIDRLKQALEKLSQNQARRVDRFFAEHPRRGQVGAFQGAGYSSEGLYRPMLDCIMFSKGKKPYCSVCEAAIIEVIRHHTGGH